MPEQDNFVKIGALSGIEAEVVRVAMEHFHREELSIQDYQLSLYINNDVYVVLFKRSPAAPEKKYVPGYEVEISAESLTVTHTQFSR